MSYTLESLSDEVSKIRKELNYILYHLDDENIPDLAVIKGDINGANTKILQTETAIQLLATDVEANTAELTVQAGQIALKVSDNDITASLIVSRINGGTVQINAANINLNGVTTMNGLARINGGVELGDPTVSSSKYIRFNNQASIRTGAELGILEISVASMLNIIGATSFNNRPYVNGVGVALLSDQVAKFG